MTPLQFTLRSPEWALLQNLQAHIRWHSARFFRAGVQCDDVLFNGVFLKSVTVSGYRHCQHRYDYAGNAAGVFFRGFSLGIGTCIGDLFYAVLALAGMAVLLQFEIVRWIIWAGGGLLLTGFTVKMLMAAFSTVNDIDTSQVTVRLSLFREFRRGIVLALSSPTAILWFATVGGALISRFGGLC